MYLELAVSAITLLGIVGFIIWLCLQPQKRILEIAVPLCVISFMIIYVFYLVARLAPGNPVFGIPAALAAFVETFGSFTNGVAYSDIAGSQRVIRLFGTFWFETLFWALHMLVIVTLAISGFAVFGRRLMDRVRVRLAEAVGKRDIYYIFGDSEGALLFGENLASGRHETLIVYFSEDYSEVLRERIASFGGALIELSKDASSNYLARIEAKHPERLVVFSGTNNPCVNGTPIAELLARKVVSDHAPFKVMCDSCGAESGRTLKIPQKPYSAMIVGFGEIGQACLKQLIMTSQLSPTGETPVFHIVGRNPISYEKFLIEHPAIHNCARIKFYPEDANSLKCCELLKVLLNDANAPLRNIYVCCTSFDEASHSESHGLRINKSIRRHLIGVIERNGLKTRDEIERMFVMPSVEETEIWTPQILLHHELDERAIHLNGYYCLNEADKQKDVNEFRDYFQRQWFGSMNLPAAQREGASSLHKRSSRAAADFMEAYFFLLGIDPREPDSRKRFNALIGELPEVLEPLGRIEHYRWCAFLYCMGYEPMDEMVFLRRVKEIPKNAEKEPSPKPQDDGIRKQHACLTTWEALPILDAIYIDNGPVYARNRTCFQVNDIENVRLAGRLIGKE